MRVYFYSTLAIILLFLFTPHPVLPDHKIVNKDDKPLMAIQLTNANGDLKTAKIYIQPKGEMVFGNDGWPVYGAGFIEAEKGKTYYVPFMWEGKDGQTEFGGFRVQRIEWDKQGRPVSIKGIRKEFEAKSKLGISSDIANPKIVDGILFLKFKERSNIEYKFKILFGKGVPFSIDPKGL